MIKALDEYEDFLVLNCLDEEEAEERIMYVYAAVRLKPLIGKAGINENRVNNICNLIIDQYFDYEISLDLIINAIYNYVNATKHCPSDKLLSDDIESFLEEYCQQ